MGEASAVEEDYYGDYFGGAEGVLEVDDPELGIGGGFGGGAVDAVEEAGGAVNHVEGEDAVNGDGVGGYFPVEKLRQVTVECAVWAAEHVVGQLEIRD